MNAPITLPSHDLRDVRQASVTAAVDDLSMAMAAWDAARSEEREAMRDVEVRAAAAVDPAAGDAEVEAFAAWLSEGRRRIETARDRTDQAEAVVALARAALAASRQAQTHHREREARRSNLPHG